ncbi:MAG: hypothetical protein ABII75_04510 [Candidatus Omnitrophota bacterium]
MKKAVIFALVFISIIVFGLENGYAFLWGKKKEETKKKEKTVQKQKEIKEELENKVKPALKPTISAADAEKARLVREKKRKEMNNTVWDIDYIPISGRGKTTSDLLTFENNRFNAATLLAKGFNQTNYTITVAADGKTVWETMQTAEKGEMAFWRGELSADMALMQGVLSRHHPDGKTEDFSFVSKSKKAITK